MTDISLRSPAIGRSFLAAAATHGGRTAILTPGASCSYSELADLALQQAALYVDSGAVDRPIAIAMPRGTAMVAAILGAAIAQRPWTILSQLGSPAQVRRQLEAIGGCDLVSAAGFDGLASTDLDVTPLPSKGPACFTPRVENPATLAAICFTSGSTGEPRGVALRHDASVHNAGQAGRSLEITPDDRYLWLASPSSAATCTAIFATLLHGACLLPVDVTALGLPRLGDWVDESRATILHTIPTLFRRFVRAVEDPGQLASLRLAKLGGEAVFPADVALFDERFPPAARLVNGLGMSEANGNVCHESIVRGAAAFAQVPIGRALPGFTLSLRDDDGKRVAIGETGRLWIEGAYLAEGYWNAATSRADPFPAASVDSDRRLFKSQDRCVQLEDGRFVHLGRSDGVTKVRGVRISFAAVEARMRSLPGVAEAVVAMPDMQSSLSAWVEPVAGTTLSANAIRAGLALDLPPEGVPGNIYILDAMPLLPGGKIDRQRLVAGIVEAAPAASGARTAVRIAQIFAAALGRTSFGEDEDFFDAGGDSLAAVTLAAALQAEWGQLLEPADLAANPTPARLHAAIGGHDLRPAVRLSPGGDALPLWMIAAAGASAFHLLPLARALGRTSYGFAAGVGEGGRTAMRVGDMTAPMFDAVRKIQPNGPYLLAGTSFGGWLAFDLARRLVAAGERVAFLGMLDAAGPGYPKLERSAPLKSHRFFHEKPIFRNYQVGLTGGPIRRRLVALARRARSVVRVISRADLERVDILHKFNALTEACLLAKRRHVLGSLPVRITAFHAEPYGLGPFRPDPTLGWAPYSTLAVETIAIPGDHSNYMVAPNVAVLASSLADALRRENL